MQHIFLYYKSTQVLMLFAIVANFCYSTEVGVLWLTDQPAKCNGLKDWPTDPHTDQSANQGTNQPTDWSTDRPTNQPRN
jgi:hypothetical protein